MWSEKISKQKLLNRSKANNLKQKKNEKKEKKAKKAKKAKKKQKKQKKRKNRLEFCFVFRFEAKITKVKRSEKFEAKISKKIEVKFYSEQAKWI